MVDALLPESAALLATGHPHAAIDWIGPTLESLRLVLAADLAMIPRSGALVRAMVLRARLAQQTNDPREGSRWAGAVVALWSSADPFLQQTVSEMANLTK
jgi:hypothetical protein